MVVLLIAWCVFWYALAACVLWRQRREWWRDCQQRIIVIALCSAAPISLPVGMVLAMWFADE